MKTCSKCGIAKDESEFSKNKKSRDGLQCVCKACTKVYQKENRDEIVRKRREYYLANKDEILAKRQE